jgi:hypothetical protein
MLKPSEIVAKIEQLLGADRVCAADLAVKVAAACSCVEKCGRREVKVTVFRNDAPVWSGGWSVGSNVQLEEFDPLWRAEAGNLRVAIAKAERAEVAHVN